MRTLTSVSSANFIESNISVTILASDQSTTWVFDHTDIVDLSGLSWEIPFGGGFGKPSNYNLMLSTSLGFIKENIPVLPKSEVRIRIDLNTDNIHPHVGTIQAVRRAGQDPNLLNLKIYDKTLDANPLFPITSIVDSYSTVHEEVSNNNFGQPYYYGKHVRPSYHVPIDSTIINLLGPVNVSSHNHVSSVYYNSRPDEGFGYTVVGGNIKTSNNIR